MEWNRSGTEGGREGIISTERNGTEWNGDRGKERERK